MSVISDCFKKYFLVLSICLYILYLFGTGCIAITMLLLLRCPSAAHVGAGPPWHLHFVPPMSEKLCAGLGRRCLSHTIGEAPALLSWYGGATSCGLSA